MITVIEESFLFRSVVWNITITSLTIGISNTVEEIFRIKHLMKPFEVVGVRDVTLVRYRLRMAA